MSSTDARRSLHVKNVSRADLLVQSYVTRAHVYPQDELPFRLYIRFFDVEPRYCPCLTAFDSDSLLGEASESEVMEEMDTRVELYLGPDFGVQCDAYYKVSPEVTILKAGYSKEWQVTLTAPPAPDVASDGVVLLRSMPTIIAGDHWYREDPLARSVRLRQASRQPQLRVSCDEVVVNICALDLPYRDFLRIRKRFHLINVGNGVMDLSVHTSVPWCLVQGRLSSHEQGHKCGAGCMCHQTEGHRSALAVMSLQPRSSTEVCVELCISTVDAWECALAARGPCETPAYPPRRRDTTLLHIYDDFQVLLTIPLILDIEYPVIKVEPQAVDFGFVADGDARKKYVTVSHTSRTATLSLILEWVGSPHFEIWPPRLRIPPGGSERVYILYSAVWQLGIAEGCINIHDSSPAGGVQRTGVPREAGWCRAAVSARGTPSRDHTCRLHVSDHTDDQRLLPRDVERYKAPENGS